VGRDTLVHPEQTVSQMVNEVLQRQAKSLADDTGETLERAMSATLKTEAARQLEKLADSPYNEQKAAEWQAALPWRRAEKRHYMWLESYVEWLEHKEKRTQYHALLEEELASLRG
jgi:hypoxanthine phosphoribosyltransferase